jgi:hypothetical protein
VALAGDDELGEVAVADGLAKLLLGDEHAGGGWARRWRALAARSTVAGRNLRSFLAAASEGDSDEDARGLAIQSASTHWTLTNSTHTGDPKSAIVFRQAGNCLQRELARQRARRNAAA